MSREAVSYNSESMLEFKTGIDEMIADLLKSPAGKANMAAEPVSRAQFGGGGSAWLEANDLFASYKSVLDELTRLSGLLSDCLEGMGIAVGMSKDGMQRTDDDIRYRMLEISRRTTEAKTKADKQAGYDTTPSGKPDATGTGQQQPARPDGQPQATETAGGSGSGSGDLG
ncbi:hypothetical protein [Streptomyces sp. NPDC048659]|uniref:hypothetical protein n=1 Tax=Streptomyces sp. NPDC048659 TaxID=3155489 RepID=UPI0034355AEF